MRAKLRVLFGKEPKLIREKHLNLSQEESFILLTRLLRENVAYFVIVKGVVQARILKSP